MDALRKALRIWPWLAAIATGLLYTGCFPPFDQGWLCWFALTPLLAAIWFSGENSRRRWLRDLLLGYVAGLIFFWTVFFWLTTVTVPGWFLVALYMAIYFAVFGWFCGVLRPRAREEFVPRRKNQWPPPQPNESSPVVRVPWLSSVHNLLLALGVAAAWTAMEWLRGWVFSGWGWNGLGVALHLYQPIIQIAQYTGIAGISFLVAFVNVIAISSVHRFILEAKIHRMRPHYDLTFTMAAVVGLFAYGFQTMQVRQPAIPLRVALVQANVAREDKFNSASALKIFDQFSRLSLKALRENPKLDLLVWPESSMPGLVLDANDDSHRYVMDFTAYAKVDLLLGAIEQDGTHAYNSALLVTEGGKRIQAYRKLHLVPYGEYIPGRNLVPLLARIVGDQVPADFDRGIDYTVFRLTNKDVHAAPLICFEDSIGELTRQFVIKGANLLVNVTNDGWFLHSAGSRQHLANAIFRCVETRRPLIRAANTGVTCIVNEFGRVTNILEKDGDQFIDGQLSADVAVPTERTLTFYARHGELFAKYCTGLAVLALAIGFLRKMRRKTEPVAIEEPVSA